MLTTVSLRMPAIVLCAVFALGAQRAEAETATSSPVPPVTSEKVETGTVTPAATPASPSASQTPAAAQPSTSSQQAAPATTTPASSTPTDSVANAVTPTAPPATPASPPVSTTPAATTATSDPGATPPATATTTTPAASTPAPAATATPAPPVTAPSTATPPAQAATTTEPPAASSAVTATPTSPAADAATAKPPAQAATTPPAATPAATETTPAASTAAAPSATTQQTPAPAQTAQPAAPVADPTVVAVRTWLQDGANTGKSFKDDVAAVAAFYAARTEAPLWVDGAGFTAKAKSAMDEVRKADDWGLSAAAFDLPSLAAAPSTEALAAAEGNLSLELLRYVRYAKGGRVNPLSLSRILDMTPPVKDANVVISELAAAAAPDTYLREQHPQHAGFKNLHKALLAARGSAEPAVEIDPALKVVLSSTKQTLKKGVDAPQVSLLRQRLKTPADAGTSDTLFDDKLELAVKAFQVERGIKATGQLSGATRVALNAEVASHRAPDPGQNTLRLVLNMERWRWMPADLGKIHVQNNIPEYITRVYKGSEVIFKERIIVGLPAWATPVFSAEMEFVGFNPSWGMPDGIKMRELAPRLQAAGGGDFFSQLFGGGGGGAAAIRAHGLKVYRGGREIPPESVNWGSADLRQYSFIQPPGGKNPLGIVKFRFPNKHDVYMHDTIERELFAQSTRALSHGCIRVQNPKQFAAIMLAEGNGLDPDGVARAMSGGGEVHLDHKIPVHMTYFTAVADEAGKVSTYHDIYGHDGKLSAALTGRALRLDPVIETSAAEEPGYADQQSAAAPAQQGQQKKSKKKVQKAPDTLADAISGFWLN